MQVDLTMVVASEATAMTADTVMDMVAVGMTAADTVAAAAVTEAVREDTAGAIGAADTAAADTVGWTATNRREGTCRGVE